MLTEAEDHDIASNDDGLAIVGKVSIDACAWSLSQGNTLRPAHAHARPSRAVAWERRATRIGAWARARGWATQRNVDRTTYKPSGKN